MDNFKVIYRILHYLEKAMDLDELDHSRLTPEALGVTPQRWAALWEMLAKEGYVNGVQVKYSTDGDCSISFCNPRDHAAWAGVFAGKLFDEKGGSACKGHR